MKYICEVSAAVPGLYLAIEVRYSHSPHHHFFSKQSVPE